MVTARRAAAVLAVGLLASCQQLIGAEEPLLRQGEACEDGAVCLSGSCADGVCCDTPCDGPCAACTAARRGAGADGECGPVAAGLDPDDECPGATTCDTGGACSLLNAGSACTLGDECAGGRCADGVCRCVAQITAGSAHTCALEADGTAWCWGQNGLGQAGAGAAGAVQAEPAHVGALGDGVAEVKAGITHTCARKLDGTVWCWGGASLGQTGSGVASAAQLEPTQVPLGEEAVELAAGSGHTCARTAGGAVHCWGGNQYGQLGKGAASGPELLPVKVTLLGDDVAGITAGAVHTCARKTDGSAWCWGFNEQGQVGDGTTQSPRPAPVPVAGLGSGLVEIAAGITHTCARAPGAVWCWGRNDEGQVGTGAAGPPELFPVPVALAGLDGEVGGLALGYLHTCATTSAGSAWCWGSNLEGQLGDGTTQDAPSPVKVAALGTGVARVVTGQNYSCALGADTLVRCWGQNSSAQLGTGSASAKEPSPVKAAIACP